MSVQGKPLGEYVRVDLNIMWNCLNATKNWLKDDIRVAETVSTCGQVDGGIRMDYLVCFAKARGLLPPEVERGIAMGFPCMNSVTVIWQPAFYHD